MEINTSRNNVLVVSREDLVVPINRSHRLLLMQLYTALLVFPALAALLYLMSSYAPDTLNLSELPLTTWMWIIFGITGAIWLIKKSYTFIRSSKNSLIAIEQAATVNQLTNGLTSYVKQLSDFFRIPSLLFGKKTPDTLPEGLKHIESELRKGLIKSLLEFTVLGSVLVGMALYFQLANPAALGQLPFYLVMSSFIGIFVIRFIFSLKWRPLVIQWVHEGLSIA